MSNPAVSPAPNNALRERLLTSAWLIPAVVGAVLLLPTAGFAVFVGFFMLLAAWEWGALTGVERWAPRAATVAALALFLLLLWLSRAQPVFLLAPAVVWWLGFAAALPRLHVHPAAARIDRLLLPLGGLVLAAPWVALVHLHEDFAHGPLLVLGLIALISLADTAAFFAGSRFGRRKLAPRLSPGKTWVGLYAALAAVSIALLVTGVLLGLSPGATLALMLLGAVTVALSVVGDLFESWLKRRRGCKDSGNLLPGHGGVLDRIDSMTAAGPVFVLGLIWLGFSA
ncbi:MAG: phosphatidate cytidylyltransferase [Thiohalocapsa sp.]|uniref:phosphatidate cytidylyltransferase n=1 Tax=Thiohalocapsa sp. TaxID=2497641 RepID=UPI0025F7B735|nr:phosphatidate cytidylyltransferase [Thiohalocapsa sp.]MCG6943319.1 phosphatidate cytidylyltransferase [Thiohalocapsa sp.]